LGSSYEVVIVGAPGASDTEAMIKALRSQFVPRKVVLFKPGDEEAPDIVRMAEFTEYHVMIDGKATAYVCRNYACETPTTDISRMLELLNVQTTR
jgi:uncharacterized protein YyaL (SSP411 family)